MFGLLSESDSSVMIALYLRCVLLFFFFSLLLHCFRVHIPSQNIAYCIDFVAQDVQILIS